MVIIDWTLLFIVLRIFWTGIGGVEDFSSSPGGIAANAGGSLSSSSSAICHLKLPSLSHAQYRRVQERMSTAPASDIASADNVLTTTFWIFFECHTIGLTGLSLFSPIFLWLAMMIIPWCESKVFSDANEASENATNLRSLIGMDCNFDGYVAIDLGFMKYFVGFK